MIFYSAAFKLQFFKIKYFKEHAKLIFLSFCENGHITLLLRGFEQILSFGNLRLCSVDFVSIGSLFSRGQFYRHLEYVFQVFEKFLFIRTQHIGLLATVKMTHDYWSKKIKTLFDIIGAC